MPASFFARLFLYWEAQLSLGLLVVQQTFVGFSIYLSVEVSRKIAEHHADPSDLFLLVGASIAPFFPGIASNYMSRLWFLWVISTFWSEEDHHVGQSRTDAAASVYISQGKDVYGQIVNFFHSALSVALNFAVGVIMVGLVLDSYVTAGFVVGFLLVLGLYIVGRSRIVSRADNHSHASAAMVTVLGKALTNLTCGNAYNVLSWKQARDQDLISYQKYRAYEGTRTFLVLATTCASFGPVAAVLIWTAATATDIAHLIALTINLPRIFQIVNASTDLVQIILELFSVIGAARIFRTLHERASTNPEQYIHTNDMTINGKNVTSLDAVFQILEHHSSGFFDIRGPNGSGKTSLLKALQKQYPSALYFSPRYRLLWPIEVEDTLSDGEYSVLALNWLLDHAEGPILLDEWDAFLSHDRCVALRRKVLRVSQSVPIIAVSHRASDPSAQQKTASPVTVEKTAPM